jgi:hypothetical protein
MGSKGLKDLITLISKLNIAFSLILTLNIVWMKMTSDASFTNKYKL